MAKNSNSKTSPEQAEQSIESRVRGYMRHSNCTLQHAQRRVAKADLVGTTMVIKGQLVKFR
jgi:hypothetical protein